MKNICIFLLLISLNINAQPYRPMLDSISTWCYTGNVTPVNIPDTFYTGNCSFPALMFMSSAKIFSTIDTIIGGTTYKITEFADYYFNPYCRYGYLREDTTERKVYYLNDQLQNEILLYDFSLQPGDTITLDFAFANGFYESGIYMLDSIVDFYTGKDTTRALYLNCTTCSGFSNTMEWIEGIGHRGDLAYIYTVNLASWGSLFWSCNFMNFPYNYSQLLARFENSQTLYNDSCVLQTVINNPCFAFMDSCSFWLICGSINENSDREISIYPNPAYDYINIVNKTDAISKIEIIDIAGSVLRELFPDSGMKTEMRIPLNDVEEGLYIIRLYGGNFVLSRKLVLNQPDVK